MEGPSNKRGCSIGTFSSLCGACSDRIQAGLWAPDAAQRRQRPEPRCLIFRRLFGGAEAAPAEADVAEAHYVADEDLPFPASLLDGTHLQGETSRGYIRVHNLCRL